VRLASFPRIRLAPARTAGLERPSRCRIERDGTRAWNAGGTRKHGPDVSIVSALGVTDVDISASGETPDVPPQKKTRSCASYSEVWTEIKTMTPLEIGILLAATALNLVTYWWQNMVSIPRVGLW